MVKIVLDRWLFWRIVLPVVVVVGGGLSVIYTGDLFGSCKTVVLSTVPSPDGKKSVVIFRKQCNATVPFSTQASMAPVGLALPAEKIPAFFIISGTPAVTANWLENSSVELGFNAAGEKIFRNQQSVGDIKIGYK